MGNCLKREPTPNMKYSQAEGGQLLSAQSSGQAFHQIPGILRSNSTPARNTIVNIPISSAKWLYGSKESVIDGKQTYVTTRRLCLVSVMISLLVSVGIGIPTCFVYMKYVSDNENQVIPIESTSTNRPIASAHRQDAKTDVTNGAARQLIVGRFTINQEELNNNKLLRWEVAVDAPSSSILTSTDDSCVIAPLTGTYAVFSQLTFRFNKNSDEHFATHALVTKSGQQAVEMIKKKQVSVAEKKYRTETVDEASNLIVFPFVQANDKICVNASPIDTIYVSPVDNMLTLYKL